MLWGSALAAGAEAHRRHPDRDQATGAAIEASRRLVASFDERAGSIDCREITGTDFTSRLDMLKYMLFKARHCFTLADRWAPEAIQASNAGLSHLPDQPPPPAASCASEVAKKMGASDRQAVMVAGFAGGLGLSGHACGALAAAIWMRTLAWSERQADPRTSSYDNPDATRTLEVFQDAAGSATQCREIAGRRFESVDQHTGFVRSGGCARLIEALAGPA
jgi:hypothetical protein